MTTKFVHDVMASSPLGPLTLVFDAQGALTMLDWSTVLAPDTIGPRVLGSGKVVTSQLAEYFAGRRQVFDFPIAPHGGTLFQRQAWEALKSIPYGQTISCL